MSKRIQISTPSMGEEEWLALKGPIESGWLTQGEKVAEFETNFAKKHQVDHALATTSCTTALHLMLAAAGISKGDEVIVPSFTWVSTANAVLYTGAKPILADVNPETFNIDFDHVKSLITEKTKAVIVVHLFGLCVDVMNLRKLLPENILIFEDAACAAGASLNGISAGAMGLAAAFSFHPRKSITTGEGGMLTTNDKNLATRASKMRNHGAEISEEQRHNGPQPYFLPDFKELGFNYRMTDLQGAIGVVQLAKLDEFIEERDQGAKIYDSYLSELDWISTPFRPTDGVHAWQAYVVRIVGKDAKLRRNNLMENLETENISTRPGTHAIHSLDYYAKLLKLTDQDLPGSATSRDTSMALPLHNQMNEEDYLRVVKAVKESKF
jgi:dTDP-4-amino-4,6-dideoxygalactose transaminase